MFYSKKFQSSPEYYKVRHFGFVRLRARVDFNNKGGKNLKSHLIGYLLAFIEKMEIFIWLAINSASVCI